MSEQPYVDPAHRVPDDQWGGVVRAAQAYRTDAPAPAPPEDLEEMALQYREPDTDGAA